MARRELDGSVVAITGAAGGIGQALARACLAAGAQVALLDVDAEALTAAAQALADPADRVLQCPCDITSEADCGAAIAAICARWGGVDVLVNNAGAGFNAPLLTGDPVQWRAMFDLNVMALCVATQLAVADMTARRAAGHVIHVGSMAGHRVPPGGGVYAATKFAVRALTEGLRQELFAANSPVRVSCISPGYVETGFAAHWHHGDEARARETYGQYPMLQAEDIADAVAWTLSTPQHVQVHDILLRPARQEN